MSANTKNFNLLDQIYHASIDSTGIVAEEGETENHVHQRKQEQVEPAQPTAFVKTNKPKSYSCPNRSSLGKVSSEEKAVFFDNEEGKAERMNEEFTYAPQKQKLFSEKIAIAKCFSTVKQSVALQKKLFLKNTISPSQIILENNVSQVDQFLGTSDGATFNLKRSDYKLVGEEIVSVIEFKTVRYLVECPCSESCSARIAIGKYAYLADADVWRKCPHCDAIESDF